MNLRVSEVIEETHDTKTFVFEDADEGGRPFDFVAGQYLTFRFDNVAEKPVVRSYTMSGSPNQQERTILTVKRVEGGLISNWLCDKVATGDVLRARGPIGKFVYDPEKDRKKLVMVAGGSGVTPFVSIIREHLDTLGQPGSPDHVALLVAYRSKQDLISWEELQTFAKSERATILTTLTREDAQTEGFLQGRPETPHLQQIFAGEYTDCTLMTCGPQALMDLAVAHGKEMGIPEEQLKTESFES